MSEIRTEQEEHTGLKRFFWARRFGTWYARYERPISTVSLIGGFVFNALTLTRVDQFWENFWVAAHLLVVAVCIILINREENEGAQSIFNSHSPEKLHFWLVNVLQFTFGGLLSTFIVFYFRSAVLAVTWPFFLLLAGAFVANESFKKHYTRISFQISFFFLSVFLFAIFLMPVLMHEISQFVFLVSGGVSIIVLILFLILLKRFTKEGFRKARLVLFSSIVGIYVIVNGLYFLNIIPPLPLSLHHAGIYHSIAKNAEGDYKVTYEEGNFLSRFSRFLSVYPTYHTDTDGRVYAYSAIFSPVSFDTITLHEWQKWNEVTTTWETKTEIDLPISGGREGGYRTYSIYTGLTSGKWRVNVQTLDGRLIGRMTFTAVVGQDAPELKTATEI